MWILRAKFVIIPIKITYNWQKTLISRQIVLNCSFLKLTRIKLFWFLYICIYMYCIPCGSRVKGVMKLKTTKITLEIWLFWRGLTNDAKNGVKSVYIRTVTSPPCSTAALLFFTRSTLGATSSPASFPSFAHLRHLFHLPRRREHPRALLYRWRNRALSPQTGFFLFA